MCVGCAHMVLKFSFVNLCSLEIEQFPITLYQFPLTGLHKLTYIQSTFPTYEGFTPFRFGIPSHTYLQCTRFRLVSSIVMHIVL